MKLCVSSTTATEVYDVEQVRLPAVEGSVTIQSNHAAVFEVLKAGWIETENKDIRLLTLGGCFYTIGNSVKVFTKAFLVNPSSDEIDRWQRSRAGHLAEEAKSKKLYFESAKMLAQEKRFFDKLTG